MKKIYLILALISVTTSVFSQIINIPDANFKSRLLNGFATKDINGVSVDIDVNNDNEISQSEALLAYRIVMQTTPYNITDITGIEYFTNLKQILFSQQPIVNADLSMLPNLQIFECPACNLSTLDIHGLANLTQVRVYTNHLQHVDFTGLTSLTHFIAYNNAFSGEVDMSPCINLLVFEIEGNDLNRLNIKNGKAQLFSTGGSFFTFTNVDHVCADENEIDAVVAKLNSFPSYTGNVQVNSYCSFVPGGIDYSIQGTTTYNLNNNDCGLGSVPFSHVKFNITDGTNSGTFVSGNGNYSLPVIAGSHTITPVLENPSYFAISPTSVVANFPASPSPQTSNFCVSANGIHPDLEVIIVPISTLRPGEDVVFKLVYRNKGNQIQSGSINFAFNDSVLDFVGAMPGAAAQSSNLVSWNFSSLLPFETRVITATFNANTPTETPPLNLNDVISYTATILPVSGDETPGDNQMTMSQLAINAFDPNDKTCIEGSTVGPQMVGEYVHYIIRFENNGTANAQNIVVKDMIDTAKFDMSTLVPLSGSHNFTTRITNTNKVEFLYENINLPFDDANNDGYVAFKIKTKPTLVVGDTFSNSASIYFDYNFPIVTNTATTSIQLLGTPDFEFSKYFILYPNPVKNTLNIQAKTEIEIKSAQIYNMLGQLVLAVTNMENSRSIDVADLTAGNYFIKIHSDKGSSAMKFIKQ
jgi:hypothetical protein